MISLSQANMILVDLTADIFVTYTHTRCLAPPFFHSWSRLPIVAGRSFRWDPPLLIDLEPFIFTASADAPALSTFAVLAAPRLSPLADFVPLTVPADVPASLPFAVLAGPLSPLTDFAPPFEDTSPLLGIVPTSAGCGSGNAGTGTGPGTSTGRGIGTGAVAGPGAVAGLERHPRGKVIIVSSVNMRL